MSAAKKLPTGPKILLFDIETAPVLAYVWGLFDQNVGLNQIHTDWHVLSWAAKWLDQDPVFYKDQRGLKDIGDDKKLVQAMWKLLDEADIVITQNGKSFDQKKLNARFVFHGIKPPSPYRHIDTLRIAKKHFAFTSNKLAYMTDKLCKKYKKLTNHKFEGFELWRQCLAGNLEAWREMERYNKHDVLSLEELYKHLITWDSTINFANYDETEVYTPTCACGSVDFQRRGFEYTTGGRYQRLSCCHCGRWTREGRNLLPKSSMRHRGIP